MSSPDSVDWTSPVEQQIWFDRFKSKGHSGLKLNEFQNFLNATIYAHLRSISKPSEGIGRDGHQEGTTRNNEIKFSYQEELQLFKTFDSKNNHMIDREEFSRICQYWLNKTFHRSRALVVVDVQNDFIDGSLALINGPAEQDGAEVVPAINNLLRSCQFQAVVYTQDWHPLDHIGFHENLHLRKYHLKGEESSKENNKHEFVGTNGAAEATGISHPRLRKLNPRAKVFDTVLFEEDKMEQKLWPVHCVQQSWGAELHPKLEIVPDAIRIYKGTLAHVDAYSAFWDNMRLNETGLRQELIDRGIDDVFFCGLALDYCVSASALDSAKSGFMTFVIEDACRGIEEPQIEKCKRDLIENGVFIINSKSVNTYCLDPSLLLKICYRIGLAMGSHESC